MLLIPLVVVLLLLVVVFIVAAVRPQRVLSDRSGQRLADVRRRTARWRWAGVGLGTLLAIGVVQVGSLGRGSMLAAPLFAFGVLAGVIVGEVRIAAPMRPHRSAPLEVRRARDYLPQHLAVAVAVAAGALGLLLLATMALGSPVELARNGSQSVQVCSGGLMPDRGPWPGPHDGLTIATLVLGGLGVASFALQRIVRRPRQGEGIVIDDVLRRRSASAVLAASGILVAAPLAGVSAITSFALLGATCASWWMTGFGWVLAVLVPVAAALAVWCAAALAQPARLGAVDEAN